MAATDETVMPFGVHKGKKLANVPADYLIFMYDEGRLKNNKDIIEYVEDNYDILYSETICEDDI